MSNKIIEWKWSIGVEYSKSTKSSLYDSSSVSISQGDSKITSINSFQIPQQSFNSSTVSLTPNQQLFGVTFRDQSRREDTNNKLSERELIKHSSMNPYMIENNYITDLNVQDNFLKPKNSSFEENGV